jgi:hypothetical protein
MIELFSEDFYNWHSEMLAKDAAIVIHYLSKEVRLR